MNTFCVNPCPDPSTRGLLAEHLAKQQFLSAELGRIESRQAKLQVELVQLDGRRADLLREFKAIEGEI